MKSSVVRVSGPAIAYVTVPARVARAEEGVSGYRQCSIPSIVRAYTHTRARTLYLLCSSRGQDRQGLIYAPTFRFLKTVLQFNICAEVEKELVTSCVLFAGIIIRFSQLRLEVTI